MHSNWNPSQNLNTLSVQVLLLLTKLWIAVFACSTILTYFAQAVSLPFYLYAWLCGLLSIVTLAIVSWHNRLSFYDLQTKDISVLLFILIFGLIVGMISVFIYNIGRVGPDEYFYSANPVYYMAHPQELIDYQIRALYIPDKPLKFISFQTAGAYEYIQSAFGYLLGFSFPSVYYIFWRVINGFLITIVTFLALSFFSKTTKAAAIGAWFVLLAMALMGDASWSPGSLFFGRSFEGKIMMLFVGPSLFTIYSLLYFSRKNIYNWLSLAALLVTLAGMSSSAIMIFPFLGFFMVVIYSFLYQTVRNIKYFAKDAVIYLSSFLYLVIFGLFVAWMDKPQNAYLINVYSATAAGFDGYLKGFYYPKFPLTFVLWVLFSIIVLILTRDKLRIFLFLWMLFVPLFVYNPFSSQFLLLIFRGIFFRLAYLYPFPLIIGITFSAIYSAFSTEHVKLQGPLFLLLYSLTTIALFTLPVSVFKSPRFNLLLWYDLPEYKVARETIKLAPKGVMLAPFPISGAILTLDPDYPQMLTRWDMTRAFLEIQNKSNEANLRSNAGNFLLGYSNDIVPFFDLLKKYPEIRSIVMRKEVYIKHKTEIVTIINFSHTQQVGGWRILWK